LKISIIKRNGVPEPLNLEKLEMVVAKACDGLSTTSPEEVLESAKLHFVDGMSSKRIQEIVIKSATNLITEEKHEYQKVAARLSMYDLRKLVYGTYKPMKFYDLYKRNVDMGKYDAELLDTYSKREFDILGKAIVHERDKDFSLAAVGQLMDKYLLQDRTRTDVYYETPQMMYMAIAMTLLGYIKDKKVRLEKVLRFYEGASTFSFSLPTPIMAGVRTPTRQFSSCVLLKVGDSLPSINASATAITNYVSKKAGIGLDHGAIRGVGAKIRNGEMEHTGILPFIKYHTAALKSCSQGGVRGGAGTTYYPFWHYEFESLIVLKNNKGVEENRERRLDYGVQLNGFFFKQFLNKETVYLFSPEDVPNLYKKFYSSDLAGFELEYIKAKELADQGQIRCKKVSADEMMNQIVNERSETGRIYIAFVDNMNTQTPFDTNLDPIYQSNLCLEVALPTKEFESEYDESGRIALCTLSSFNMSKFVDALWDKETREEFWKDCEVLVMALDGLLEYQDYPMIQAKLSTQEFRTLGVGIVNLADFHALLGVEYGEPLALEYVNKFMEMLNYGLLKASNGLAKDYGACTKSHTTSYGNGEFMWKLRNKNVDKLVKTVVHFPEEWETLSEDCKKYGIRNATVMAVAPTESSAQVLNATNGMEMPRSNVSIKASKSGTFKQVVPNPELPYQLLWDQKSPRGYLATAAIMQKHTDQSLSTNTFYNPQQREDSKVLAEAIISDLYYFYKLGGKTLYYSNFNDGADDEMSVDKEPECDTCVV
jgi:ribonucleoside-diphosphate reductase alpha chain